MVWKRVYLLYLNVLGMRYKFHVIKKNVHSLSLPAVQFTFTPSPEANIGVYQLAHYQCSVDHTDVGITWHVNGKGSADSDIIQLGIVTNGAGSSNSSLTIPGYPQYNNTVVRCNAAGFVNNQGYFNFGESTLRIQGDTSLIVHLNYSFY